MCERGVAFFLLFHSGYFANPFPLLRCDEKASAVFSQPFLPILLSTSIAVKHTPYLVY